MDTQTTVELEHKAVAYAVTHVEEMPESVKRFVTDLYEYEESGKRLNGLYNQTKAALKQIEEQMTGLYGSIEAVIRIVVRELGEEKVKEFGSKYVPTNATEVKQEETK